VPETDHVMEDVPFIKSISHLMRISLFTKQQYTAYKIERRSRNFEAVNTGQDVKMQTQETLYRREGKNGANNSIEVNHSFSN
jgi:hypothetical protein